jgi:hypothetical protein
MSKGIFIKKSIGELVNGIDDGAHSLKRALVLNLVSLGLGAIIGAGILY